MRKNRDSWVFALTVASAASVLVSIAAAQIMLGAACLAWLVFRPRGIVWPSYFVPLLAFLGTTLLSLFMSAEPQVGMGPVRKFVLFSMGLLAANFVTNAVRAVVCHSVLLAVAALTSTVAIIQFASAYIRYLSTQQLADDPTVMARITGFMGHWMTFSGEQLLVWCAAVPALVVLGRRWLAPAVIVGAALVLSFTRSVWLGAVAGVAAIALAIPGRLLFRVLVPILIVALAASGLIYHRVSMSLGPNFSPDTGRLEMFATGMRMIRDHPLFGVGPERVSREFPRYYAGTNLNNFYYGHLHNNIVQIAAERGLICLATFLWLTFEMFASLIARLKTADEATRWTTLSALSALTGFVVAGFFEYNFGDSEVLLLLLFIVSLPFGLETQNDLETRLHSNVGTNGVSIGT